jgi:hypothetical protein
MAHTIMLQMRLNGKPPADALAFALERFAARLPGRKPRYLLVRAADAQRWEGVDLRGLELEHDRLMPPNEFSLAPGERQEARE